MNSNLGKLKRFEKFLEQDSNGGTRTREIQM